MFVNFAASVMNLLIELSANKFECLKMNKCYFGISYSAILYNYNYLLLAMIVICNATMIPIDAIIGNNNELS